MPIQGDSFRPALTEQLDVKCNGRWNIESKARQPYTLGVALLSGTVAQDTGTSVLNKPWSWSTPEASTIAALLSPSTYNFCVAPDTEDRSSNFC